MDKPPTSVSAARVLVLLNAIVWLAFGVIIAIGAHPALPDSILLKWAMAILGLLTSGILLALFIYLGRRSRLAFFATLAVLGSMSVLTMADEVGLADLAVLGITIAAIVCLIGSRAWFLQGRAGTPDPNRAA
jgi:hypothetical protein